LVIRVSREPAENTSTSPLGIALAELDAEVVGEVDVELEDELLHPAAARPVQAMASRATTGALLFVKAGIIPRTLPLIVASRKESRHHWDELPEIETLLG
jgi:hypothetical protein